MCSGRRPTGEDSIRPLDIEHLFVHTPATAEHVFGAQRGRFGRPAHAQRGMDRERKGGVATARRARQTGPPPGKCHTRFVRWLGEIDEETNLVELTINQSNPHRSRPAAAREASMKPTRTTSDTNVLVRTAVLLTMVVAAFFLVFSAGVDADSTPRETVLHVVQPGDTLWNLASRYTPAGDDVRVTVGVIRDINGLSQSSVAVGSAIQVPVP